MSALNGALCRCGIILWLAVLLASRSTHSAPVYDQDTTQIAEYDGAVGGCYFNFQRYQEGDRIITSEPCLNCTCHNRMLMCYLKVCPFTKAIGQDCTVEKRPDQCCPVITCPEVPVQLLTSTTSAPTTEIGFHDNYGCNVDDRFYPDGAQLAVDHHNPCELCYCIRNKTTCVMQECTLRVAGCKPIYQAGVCCPIRYNCEYDEEPITTVGTTPGLIMTTTLPPGVLPQCYHEGKVYEDGELIYSTQPCQHCYCFRGEIACAVQNCGTPMQAHGKNCTALPPPEGECCPTTYQCEEDGGIVTLPEEQVPAQDSEMTESPMLIDQEKDQHPQGESFPGADNAIPVTHEVEEEEGTVEHVTRQQIPSTEKPEEEAAIPVDENEVKETTVAEEEFTSSYEHITEEATKLPAEEESPQTQASTTVREIEETTSEEPAVELPATTSEVSHAEKETIATEHTPEDHISTEEKEIEREHSTLATEKEQSTEPSVSDEAAPQTESVAKAGTEESTTPHEELPARIPEEVTETAEKTPEEEQFEATKAPKEPEISTEILEKASTTSSIEETEPSSTIVSITESTKEDGGKLPETTSEIIQATETELPIGEETATVSRDTMSSTEQAVTEKEEISHPTEGSALTEEAQSTEAIGPSKEQPDEEEQKPVASEEEGSKEATSEYDAITKEAERVTVSPKKEDQTEGPVMSEEPVTEEQYTEKSTPEIPSKGPTGIPIPERMPEQKAEDKYHVTEGYQDITPEIISSDNLMTEAPTKISTTHLPEDQEITPTPSEETVKPIVVEGTESPAEGTTKPISEESTEVNLPTQKEPSVTEITTGLEEIKTESIPAQGSTESSAATSIAHEEYVPEEKEKPSVPEEIETEISQTEVQPTEQAPSGEELPTKGLTVEESGETSSEEVSTDLDEKESQPKKEESSEKEREGEIQPPVSTKATETPETPVSIPAEYSTIPSRFGEEEEKEGERVTTVSSTYIPQTEEKDIEKEEIPVISEKPIETHPKEEPSATQSVTGEEEEKLQTEKPVLEEEKPTTSTPAIEEGKTEQPEQYSTQKSLEEATESQTPIIEKKPEETEGMTEDISTEIIGIEQTELPVTVKHPTEKTEEEESEEKISVPESIQTEIPSIGIESTEAPFFEKETEKAQTEPSESGEYLPTQPSVTDRKEDQEPIESKPSEGEREGEERITEKPSLGEEEVTETYETSEKSTVPSETEGTVTVSVLPEEKPIEDAGTTESVGTDEGTMRPTVEEQPEKTSEQPEEITGQEEHTRGPVIEQQPEIHVRKETETISPIIPEEPYVTSTSVAFEKPTTVKEDASASESTETTPSEDTEKPILISETSTELPALVEEHTEKESVIPEIITMQPLIPEEKPIEETESVPVEISTEEAAITPVIKQQPPEGEEINKETTVETSTHEYDEHSTVVAEEIPETKITTEVPSKEIPQYSTEYPVSIPQEIPVEEEEDDISKIVPRPSGIPGEGNCLVEGQSYGNNSAVPPANACQISCRCVSSIVQCELVQCPAPPIHLPNCMPIHTSEDSCCPMYACDSMPIDELESDSHLMEPHINKTEEDQSTVPSLEISTEEAAKESGTIAEEISTPLSVTEITVSSASESEEEAGSQTTVKFIEPLYEQPTTAGLPVERQPEEHTVSSVSEITEEFSTKIPEKETEHITEPQSVSEETTGDQEEEKDLTKSSTEQPQEPVEEHTSVSGEEQIITSTYAPIESHEAEEEKPTSPPVSTATKKEETFVPVEVEEIMPSTEEKAEEVTTAITGKEEETTVAIKEEEKSTEEGVEEQFTSKPVEEIEEQEKPGEEKIQPTSEYPISSTVEEHEIVTKPEEVIVVTEKQPAKPEVSEEEKTIKPTEYESTSIPEIQPTTESKFDEETKYEMEEKKQETVTSTEGEQAVQTEEPVTETKLPIAPGEVEKQETIAPPAVETTTVIHATTEEASFEERATVKPVEISTEESEEKTKPEIFTEIPEVEKEHVTLPTSSVEAETPGDITTEQELEKAGGEKTTVKPIEEIVPHEATSPGSFETTESAMGIETTEHVEEHTELPVTETEKELPEEKPSDAVPSEFGTEKPAETTEIKQVTEEEYEKPTELSIAYKPESTQVPIEEHPEIESHTTELPVEEHTIAKEEPTTSVQKEPSEQPVTPIVKDISESRPDETETEQPILEAESEKPMIEEEEEEHVTVAIEKQTPKFEEQPVEEQTVVSSTPSEGEISPSGISIEESTSEVATSQEQEMTEKTAESDKPETESPDLTEEHTVASETEKEVGVEKQKPEAGITEETSKEEPVTEVGKEATTESIKEESATDAFVTEKLSVEEHTEKEAIIPSEIELGVKIQPPAEFETSTIPPKEQESEEESQVTSEAGLPEYPVSEESTTVTTSISEKYPTPSVETGEEKEEGKPEYQTTLATVEEEVSKPTTSEIEKSSPEEESVTVASATEGPEEPITKVSIEESSVKQPEEISPETIGPYEEQQKTESPEKQQGETTTKEIEGVVKERLPEEVVPQMPETEEKITEAPVATGGEEEAHSTEPTLSIETTPIHEEKEPSITKLQPTEVPPYLEQETFAPEEILSQPEEGEEAHSVLPEEFLSTEHAPETPIAAEPEKHPEISEETPEEEHPIEVSDQLPTELPTEEKITVGSISPEEPQPEIPTRPEEGPQSVETPAEEHVTKTQPVSTEIPAGETTDEISQEGEEVVHPHVDQFPEPPAKEPEPDYSAEGELTLGFDDEHLRPVNHTVETTERPYRPGFHEQTVTTSAPHIPEYPDQSVSGEDNSHFPLEGGWSPDEDYDEDDQAVYGPGTCRYGGKVYVSAQQIPRDDPCDFCFCFRSDIICLQQSCPPPIPGCHEEPISGFCCPRYECPVSMATALNLTTTTTTTTTTLPPHFPPHAYKGAARRSGCQINGQAYRVGEVIKSASGPCLHCTCGGDGNMKCDPRNCNPEPMMRQIIATVAKRRR